MRSQMGVPQKSLSFRHLGELRAGREQQLVVNWSVLEEPVGFGGRRHRQGPLRSQAQFAGGEKLQDPDLSP